MGNLGEELSVFEAMHELLGAIYIQECRNYDMLSIIADKLGANAKGLSKLHEQGQVLAPPPAFVFEDNEDKKNDLQDSLFDEDMTNNDI